MLKIDRTKEEKYFINDENIPQPVQIIRAVRVDHKSINQIAIDQSRSEQHSYILYKLNNCVRHSFS